jgi:hypothetical protein
MMIGAVMAFAAALGGGGIQAQPAPVQLTAASAIPDTSGVPIIPTGPVGAWAIYGDGIDSCGVARNYGTVEKPLTVSIRPSIGQSKLTLFVIAPATPIPLTWGPGTVALTPGASLTIRYSSFNVIERGQHFDVVAIDRSALDGLAAAGKLTVRLSTVTTIPASEAMAALRAMDRCQTALFASWGIDPALYGYGKPAPMAVVAPYLWFTSDDYPPAAAKAHQQGRVMAALEIGSDGLVKACHVVVSAGTALDETSCRILLVRARFKPAHDAAGKPIASWAIVPVRWAMHD